VQDEAENRVVKAAMLRVKRLKINWTFDRKKAQRKVHYKHKTMRHTARLWNPLRTTSENRHWT